MLCRARIGSGGAPWGSRSPLGDEHPLQWLPAVPCSLLHGQHATAGHMLPSFAVSRQTLPLGTLCTCSSLPCSCTPDDLFPELVGHGIHPSVIAPRLPQSSECHPAFTSCMVHLAMQNLTPGLLSHLPPTSLFGLHARRPSCFCLCASVCPEDPQTGCPPGWVPQPLFSRKSCSPSSTVELLFPRKALTCFPFHLWGPSPGVPPCSVAVLAALLISGDAGVPP